MRYLEDKPAAEVVEAIFLFELGYFFGEVRLGFDFLEVRNMSEGVQDSFYD